LNFGKLKKHLEQSAFGGTIAAVTTLAESFRFLTHKELRFTYSFFGLLFRSNLEIPGVNPVNQFATQSDVEVRFGISPCSAEEDTGYSEELTYVSSDTNAIGEPVLRIWNVKQGAFVRLAYEDGTQFWLDHKRENIWATWPPSSSIENTTSYLLGPILGLALRLRGVTCLHASAVAFEDRSVAFVGQTGAGKSTTAAAFARQGYGVISDDIVALKEHEGAFQAIPAYPHLYLWPESVKMLYESAEALPRLIPDWDKRRLNLGERGTRFETRSLPLGAVYILSERRLDPAPYVESMRPQSALVALVGSTYANKVLDRDMRASEFAVLGKLATTIPIRQIHAHRLANRLEELCKVIREDFATLNYPTAQRP
jgi:hypothetical protein